MNPEFLPQDIKYLAVSKSSSFQSHMSPLQLAVDRDSPSEAWWRLRWVANCSLVIAILGSNTTFLFQVDGLETEVSALKALVITSTPSNPGPGNHLHQSHHRVTSDTSLGDAASSPSSPARQRQDRDSVDSGASGGEADRHIDPVLRQEYLSWKKSPDMKESNQFLARIYREDVEPCLQFPAADLSSAVRAAIHANTLCLVPCKPDTQENPRSCALLQQPRTVRYRLRLDGDTDTEYFICQLARNRLASVCDFLTYCRWH